MTFFESLLMCEASLQAQLTLLVLNAIFWFVFIPWVSNTFVKPYIDQKPWKDQFVVLNQKTFAGSFGIKLDKPDVYQFACDFIPVLCQHGVGGALCIPAVFGFFSPEVQTTLACHGALCEAGWELQDGLTRAYMKLFGTEDQKRLQPTLLLVIIGFHHAMGLSMVVPMNLYFPSNSYYHEGIFLLQFAAFCAMMAQNYGLDVGTASGLLKMRVCIAFVFMLMVYSRALRFAYVVFRVVCFLYDEGGQVFFIGSVVASVLMSLLNVLMVMDALGKLVKFFSMKSGKHSPALMRHASSQMLTAATAIHGIHQITTAQGEWAKIRGLVAMGAFKKHE